MNFQKYKPSKSLEPIVAYYWTITSSEHDAPNGSYRFVPDAYVDWVFHLNSPWQCDFPDVTSQTKTSRFHVFGHIKKYIDLTLPKDDIHVFGVKFYPWVARQIWKLDMHYLTDRCLDLESLDLPDMNTLQEKIISSKTTSEQIKHLESYLLKTVAYNDKATLKPILGYSYDDVQYSKVTLDIGERRLQQRFQNEIGISHSLFLRTLRINNVIHHLKYNARESLTQVALEYGFFDQSHFIKDFKQFTGLAPSKFLKSINPDGDILNLQAN